ncbi:MAG: sulfatase [Myxococcota bacterium]
MLAILMTAVVLAAPPDFSKAYFTGLERPNARRIDISRQDGPVILVVVDALRPDRISPYGFSRDTTPNLERLADEGLVLTNYFVNGNWTRPTTASLLTGLPPPVHGVEREGDKLAAEFATLAEVLSGVGVPTGAVVGNGNAGSAFGLSRGFDFYADTVKHWKGLPSAEQVTELAVPFVRQHQKEPFFLMLFFVDPHDPYHAPGEFENMYVEDLSVPLIRTPHWELGNYSVAEVERMKATYDGAVRYTDTVLGRFFEQLRQLGIYDKATIIVTSDHGEAFGEHGVFLHSHHFYDEIVRAPLIIKAPKMSVRGAYNHYLFQTIDLLPTLVSYYGVPVNSKLPGVDILAHLKKPMRNDPQRAVISSFYNFGINRRMIRTYREKIIYEEPADEKEFLATVGKRSLLPSVSFDGERIRMFNVAKDPFEHEDVFRPSLLKQKRWKRLFSRLKAQGSKHKPPTVVPLVGNIDPETYQDLRALGYIQ